MRRWLAAALIAFSSLAHAGSVQFYGGMVGAPAPPVSAFDVYPGCTPYSVAGTRKTWYFSDQTDSSTNTPAMGHTPAYYAGNNPSPVPQAQWGDINHPLYPIQNLFDFGSNPFTQSAGWTGVGNGAPLDGMNIYLGPPGVTVHQSFADYNSLIAGDTSHFYLWPGDEVILKGHTGVDVGTWRMTAAIGSTSPLGKTSLGLHEIDQAGNTVYTYIHGDPAGARPMFDFISAQSNQGIVLQGVNINQKYIGYLTTPPNRFFLWAAGNFTDGQTVNLDGYVMTFRNSPVASQDVQINSTSQQLSIINLAKNFLNVSGDTRLTATTQQSQFILTQTFASNPTNGTSINVNGVTWTFVSGAPSGNQVQIQGSLSATLSAAVTAFKANTTDANMGVFSYGSTSTALTFNYGNTFLTQTIASNPSNGQTLNVHNVIWTWVTSAPTGRQIAIGGSTSVSIANAAAALSASTDPLMTPWTYTPVGSQLQFLYAKFPDGTTVALNGVTWTYKNSVVSSRQIATSPSGTKWEALGNAMLAFDAFGANPWGTGVVATSNGSGMLTIGTVNGLAGIYEASSSHPQNDPVSPVHLSTWSLGGTQGLQTSSASVIAFAKDNIFDDILVTGWDGIKQSAPSTLINDTYPTTGSLGVDPTTGIVGTPGGPWTIMDWAIQPNFTGFLIQGNQTGTSGSNTAGGNSCTTLSHSKAFYVGTGVAFTNMNNYLLKNVQANYVGNDQGDDYSSWNTTWQYFLSTNGINNGQAFHPDFIQVGISGANNGVMDNHVYDGVQLLFATDPAINTYMPNWTNMAGVVEPTQTATQGINANGALHNQLTVTNSLFITPACIGVSVETVPTGNVKLLNNTVLQPGVSTGTPSYCSAAPSFTPHVRPDTAVTETIDMENNVSNTFSMGSSSPTSATICPLGSNVTFAKNVITQSNHDAALAYFAATYCPDGVVGPVRPSSSGPPSSMFNGGITTVGAPAVAFTTYPTSNLSGNPNAYNLRPLPSGPLDGTGSLNSLQFNVIAQPRNQPPNSIGAY